MDDDTLDRLRSEVLFLQAQVRAMDAELQELKKSRCPPARYGLGGWYRS